MRKIQCAMRQALAGSVCVFVLTAALVSCRNKPLESPSSSVIPPISSSAESTNLTQNTTSHGAESTTALASSGQTSHTRAVTTAVKETLPVISAYTIVHAKQAGATEKKAAAELQRYLKQITGRTLPVKTDDKPVGKAELIIGKTAREQQGYSVERSGLGTDGFCIKRIKSSIVIAGGGERGTIYGVYDFLERYFGCRFYAENVEQIPKKAAETFRLPTSVDVREVPDFVYRAIDWHNTFHVQTTAKLRINSAHNREKAGDFSEYGGLLTFANGMFVHTFGQLIPGGRYFEEHPEYFSLNMVDGQLIRTKSQRCLSNPEVLRISIAAVKKALAAAPDSPYVAVSQNDVVAPCLCNKCAEIDAAEGSQAGSVLRFVNAIADAVKKEYPHVLVVTDAYFYTSDPPRLTKPRDNVLIRLSTARNCCSHPFETDTGHIVTQQFREKLNGWKAISKHLYVWDYTTNFGHYLAPFPNLFTLQPNLQYLKKNGVTGYLAQGNYQGTNGEFGELRAYMLSKLLWKADTDVNALINEFLKGYYGAGWTYIRQYIDEYQKASASYHLTSTINNAPQDSMPVDSPQMAEAFIARMEALWAAAEQAAVGSERERVQRSRLQWRYYKQVISKSTAYDHGTVQQKSDWMKENETLYRLMKQFNVLYLRENKQANMIDFTKSPDTW